MVVKVINGLIDTVAWMLNSLMLLLPDSPFHFDQFSWGPFGDAIGFVFPVVGMAAHFTAIMSAFLGYYAVRWALRLIRQIQ